MNERPNLSHFLDSELIDIPQFADVFDLVGQEVRDALKSDPGRYPTPLYFSGHARWPWAQLQAWVRAGEPRDFSLPATDFVPAAIAAHADNHQTPRVTIP